MAEGEVDIVVVVFGVVSGLGHEFDAVVDLPLPSSLAWMGCSDLDEHDRCRSCR